MPNSVMTALACAYLTDSMSWTLPDRDTHYSIIKEVQNKPNLPTAFIFYFYFLFFLVERAKQHYDDMGGGWE